MEGEEEMRKPGVLRPGSVQHQISLMEVGEVKWVETTAEGYAHVQREWNLAKSRRVAALKEYEVSCSVWTAIGPATGQAPVILVRVQRVK